MKTTLPCIYFKYKSKHYLRNNSLRNRLYFVCETFCRKQCDIWHLVIDCVLLFSLNLSLNEVLKISEIGEIE